MAMTVPKGKELMQEEEGPATCSICEITAAKGLDSWPRATCKICAAKVVALNRIKAAGGDSVQAAKDSAARVRGDICVVKALPSDRVLPWLRKTAAEGNKARPTGVVKKTIRVPEAYIEGMLTKGPRITPLRPLPEDFFEKNPQHREFMIEVASTVLLDIDQHENILLQFFKKGFAMMEVEVDYDY